MMSCTRTIVTAILLMTAGGSHGQLPDWLWTTGASGDSTSGDAVVALDVDPWGNTLVLGRFSGTMALGAHILTATGTSDAFVAKLGVNGEWIWAVGYDGANLGGGGSGIAVDDSGNSYITGNFAGSIAIADTLVPANGGADMYVAKLDSAGQWLWASFSSGGGAGYSSGIALDPWGHVYVAGTFGPSEQWGPLQLTSSSNIAPFVTRLDTAGNWQWATGLDVTVSGIVRGMAFSENEGPIVVGVFQDQLIVGADTLLAGGSLHAFIAAVDTSGTPSWARQTTGTGNAEARNVAVDGFGRIYVCGALTSGTVEVGDSVFVTNNADGVLVRLSPNGFWEWSQRTTGSGTEWFEDVAVHEDGWLLLGGHYSTGEAQIAGTVFANAGGTDGLIAGISPIGSWLLAKSFGGTLNDVCWTIAGGPVDAVHVGGSFSDQVPFGMDTLAAIGGSDGFVGKLGVLATMVNGAATSAYSPWILQEHTSLTLRGLAEGPAAIRVYDSTGRLVHQHTGTAINGSLPLGTLDLSAGAFLVQVQQGGQQATLKFMAR